MLGPLLGPRSSSSECLARCCMFQPSCAPPPASESMQHWFVKVAVFCLTSGRSDVDDFGGRGGC
eukprot:14609537-Alexandrium_andersonii.AAC.1